jgi:two-component system sensor histidine kinase BarA
MRMLNEPYLQRAALLQADGKTLLSIGYQPQLTWPKSPPIAASLSVHFHHNTIYAAKVSPAGAQPAWLVIELDNKPLEIAHYRVITVLLITVFITLLLLMMCLNFYSRRWIAPLYEIRMQLQRLNADNLDQPVAINSSGELRSLQKDLANMLKRLHYSF